MRTASPVCGGGGGVVWGCLVCYGCSDGEKNAVANLLALDNALELLALGYDGATPGNAAAAAATKRRLVAFARSTWAWLQQADAGVAGLVDHTSGIVYDKFRPVLAAERANQTNASGLEVRMPRAPLRRLALCEPCTARPSIRLTWLV